MDEREFFERLAELAIRVGVNLQPDQDLVVWGDVEHSPLVRATMDAGWRAGASDVQCLYRDPYDRLFLGRHAAATRLERSPFATLALWDYLADGQRAIVFLRAMRRPISIPTSTRPAWRRLCPGRCSRGRLKSLGVGESRGQWSRFPLRHGRPESSVSPMWLVFEKCSRTRCDSTSRIPRPRGEFTSPSFRRAPRC